MSKPAAKYVDLIVKIVRIWNDPMRDPQPGLALGIITDVLGREHRFFDKIPIFTAQYLEPDDVPCDGIIRCAKVKERADGTILVDTYDPDHVESTRDEHLFCVFPHQLTNTEVFQ